VTAVTKRFRF